MINQKIRSTEEPGTTQNEVRHQEYLDRSRIVLRISDMLPTVSNMRAAIRINYLVFSEDAFKKLRASSDTELGNLNKETARNGREISPTLRPGEEVVAARETLGCFNV